MIQKYLFYGSFVDSNIKPPNNSSTELEKSRKITTHLVSCKEVFGEIRQLKNALPAGRHSSKVSAYKKWAMGSEAAACVYLSLFTCMRRCSYQVAVNDRGFSEIANKTAKQGN